jgi:HAE1 family hydrophobic/amphiphilic exporter-1
MARVVIGGLLSSTVITLVLVPVIYFVLEGRAHRKRSAANAKVPTDPQWQAVESGG